MLTPNLSSKLNNILEKKSCLVDAELIGSMFMEGFVFKIIIIKIKRYLVMFRKWIFGLGSLI